MTIIIALLAMVVTGILTIQLLGSYEEIPVLTCMLAVIGFAMVARNNNTAAAWLFLAAPLPIIRIRNKQKAQLWHDLQGQEGNWTCPDFYDPRDWDSNEAWRNQEWWDG